MRVPALQSKAKASDVAHAAASSSKQDKKNAKGKEVLLDLEKRCHYHSTTNVKGDSHESAYMEGQRSVILFIKSMLRKDKGK